MLLVARELCAGYGRLPVLHDIDFEVDEGEVVAVLGANGAGKSTLMKTLARVLAVMSGHIEFGGTVIDRWGAVDAARGGVTYVPQENNVFAGLTVAENLRISASHHGGHSGKAIEEALDHLPILRERATQPAGTLSGGQRQQLAVASALLTRPRLLLLDEPTTGLAPLVVQEMLEWISTIVSGGMTTVWVVEQSPELALDLADRAYVMGGGQIVREGPADAISSETLREVLLGEHV